MTEKDMVEKALEDYNDVHAFGGDQSSIRNVKFFVKILSGENRDAVLWIFEHDKLYYKVFDKWLKDARVCVQ